MTTDEMNTYEVTLTMTGFTESDVREQLECLEDEISFDIKRVKKVGRNI